MGQHFTRNFFSITMMLFCLEVVVFLDFEKFKSGLYIFLLLKCESKECKSNVKDKQRIVKSDLLLF